MKAILCSTGLWRIFNPTEQQTGDCRWLFFPHLRLCKFAIKHSKKIMKAPQSLPVPGLKLSFKMNAPADEPRAAAYCPNRISLQKCWMQFNAKLREKIAFVLGFSSFFCFTSLLASFVIRLVFLRFFEGDDGWEKRKNSRASVFNLKIYDYC